jgi:hypothetical protein
MRFLIVCAGLFAVTGGHGQTFLKQSVNNHLVSGNEKPTLSVLDSSGNLFIVGTSDSQILIQKLDKKLDPVWDTEWDSPIDLKSAPLALTLAPSGKLIAAIATNYFVDDWECVFSLLSVNTTTGAITETAEPFGTLDGELQRAVFDSVGDLYVYGAERTTLNEGNELFTAKIDPNTNSVLWNSLLTVSSGVAISQHLQMACSPAGTPYLFGGGLISNGNDEATATVYQLNPHNGSVAWEYQSPIQTGLNGPQGGFGAMTFDGANNPILVGSQNSVPFTTGENSLAVKLNASTGGAIWSTQTPITGNNDYYSCVALDPSGNVLTGGTGEYSQWKAFGAKLDGNTGAVLWSRPCQYVDLTAQATAITSDGDGNAVLQFIDSPTDSNPISHLNVVSLDGSTGAGSWSERYVGSTAGNDAGGWIFLANGGVYSVGTSYTSATRGLDMLVQNLAPATGTVTDEAVIDRMNHAQDTVLLAVAGPGGSVVEEGLSQSPLYQNYPILTKFGPTGAVEWSNVIPSALSGVLPLTVAPDGSVYLCTRNLDGDVVVTKFGGATGNVLWQTTYTEQPGGAVATCAAPNNDLFVVIGTSINSKPVWPIVRFSATTGKVLWTADPNYGGSNYDVTLNSAVALPDGSVVVGGVNSEDSNAPKGLMYRITATGGTSWDVMEGNASFNGGSVVGEADGDPIYLGVLGAYAMRVDGSTGEVKWFHKYPPGQYQSPQILPSCADASGNVYFAGKAVAAGTSNMAISVRKLNVMTGALTNAGICNGPGVSSTALSIMVDGGGLPEVLSMDVAPSTMQTAYSVIKFDSSGLVEWDVPFTYPKSLATTGVALYPAAGGNVGLAGIVDMRQDQGGPSEQSASIVARQTASPVTLSGSAILQDYVADPTQVPLTVQVRNAGSLTALQTRVVYLDKSGAFNLEACVPPGKYDVTLEGPHWLRQMISNLRIGSDPVSGLRYWLVNGDVDGNNSIAKNDLETVIDYLGVDVGSPYYNPQFDVNGDGKIDITDLNILKENYGQKGAR